MSDVLWRSIWEAFARANEHNDCCEKVWPNLPSCAPHPGPAAVIVSCPLRGVDDE